MELTRIKEAYAVAREKYKPSRIRTLLIAEAPPESLERFFYFEDVKQQDSLFLQVMTVLYPTLRNNYSASGREPSLKTELLQKFKADGFWLIDLSELPKSLLHDPIEKCVDQLLVTIGKMVDKNTRIILMKANVFDCCFAPLSYSGYKVSPERIPFPGSGQQKVFREKFVKALNEGS